MIADLAAALLLITGDQGPDPRNAAFDARMAESAEAAERLQGELDGCWRLMDAKGRGIFVFQISDRPGGAAPLEAAWRDAEGKAMGLVDAISRAQRQLTIRFPADGRSARLSLWRTGRARWQGWLIEPGERFRVSLRR